MAPELLAYNFIFNFYRYGILGFSLLLQVSAVGHFELSFASVSKRVFMQNHSNGNEFCVQAHVNANQT